MIKGSFEEFTLEELNEIRALEDLMEEIINKEQDMKLTEGLKKEPKCINGCFYFDTYEQMKEYYPDDIDINNILEVLGA